MEITKREVIASVVIIGVMLSIGFTISESIQQSLLEQYQVYDTAVQIDSEEIFRYGMETDIGHAFVYGDLKTVDHVTFSEIEGQYSYIKKEEQEYTRHSREVEEEYEDSEGNTHTRTVKEYYWTWDTTRTETKTSTKISFLNVEFEYSKIPFPSSNYITTLNTGYHKRNVYYGTGTQFKGTIFSTLKGNTINESLFFEDKTISETIEDLETGYQITIFWIFWILLTAGLVVVFYYLKNRWLH